MFRISTFMQELLRPTPPGEARKPPGPVVIWNLIRRCNLACRHCYSVSADVDFAGELSTAEAFNVMDDLRAFGVPVLILSGGEPLLRRDIFEIAARAKQQGFYVALSTNGTLIDAAMAQRIAAAEFNYVGISLDGRPATHDKFRRREGAFSDSINALRLCRDLGVKVGVRFTLTEGNASDLPWLLDLCDEERIDKFYLSHLNYAGRGNINRKEDAFLATTRHAMDQLFERCFAGFERGEPKGVSNTGATPPWESPGYEAVESDDGVKAATKVGARGEVQQPAKEFVTGNNDADGVYFLQWARARFPEREAHLRMKLAQWGGNSSGVNVANIDNLGNVHPDTYWWDYSLGNVRERPFSQIWRDTSDPIMAGLKARPRPIKGRCGACRYFDICGGNTRVRARELTGDPWQEDPACYLDDDEIGVAPGGTRVTVTPYSRWKKRADAEAEARGVRS